LQKICNFAISLVAQYLQSETMTMTKQRACANREVLPEANRREIHDCLTLALDELETGPLDYIAVRRIATHYLRPALKAVHRHMEVVQ
jgi:hypothetical protein